MNKLMLHIKQLDKEEQAKPKVSRRKEIIKMREEINEQQKRPMKLKFGLRKIRKIDKPLPRLINRK